MSRSVRRLIMPAVDVTAPQGRTSWARQGRAMSRDRTHELCHPSAEAHGKPSRRTTLAFARTRRSAWRFGRRPCWVLPHRTGRSGRLLADGLWRSAAAGLGSPGSSSSCSWSCIPLAISKGARARVHLRRDPHWSAWMSACRVQWARLAQVVRGGRGARRRALAHGPAAARLIARYYWPRRSPRHRPGRVDRARREAVRLACAQLSASTA
jgi:hypothetical protein